MHYRRKPNSSHGRKSNTTPNKDSTTSSRPASSPSRPGTSSILKYDEYLIRKEQEDHQNRHGNFQNNNNNNNYNSRSAAAVAARATPTSMMALIPSRPSSTMTSHHRPSSSNANKNTNNNNSRPQSSHSAQSRIEQIISAPTALDRHILSLPSDEDQNPCQDYPWWQRAVLDQDFRKQLVSYISSAHRMLDEYSSSIPQPWDLPAADRGKSVEGKKFELNFSSADKDGDGNIRKITRVKSANYYTQRNFASSSSPLLSSPTKNSTRPGTSSSSLTMKNQQQQQKEVKPPTFSTFSKITPSEISLQNSMIKNTHKDIALARGSWIPYSVHNRAPGDGPTYRWMGDFPPCGFHISFTEITGDLEQISGGVLKPPNVPSFETIGTPECPAAKALYATKAQFPLLGGVVVPKDVFCVYLVAEHNLRRYASIDDGDGANNNNSSLIKNQNGNNGNQGGGSSNEVDDNEIMNKHKQSSRTRYASLKSMQRMQVQHRTQSATAGDGDTLQKQDSSAAASQSHKDDLRFTSDGGARYQLIDREDTTNLIVVGTQQQQQMMKEKESSSSTATSGHNNNNNNISRRKKHVWNIPIISQEEEDRKKKQEKKLFGIFSVEEMKKFRTEQQLEDLKKQIRAEQRQQRRDLGEDVNSSSDDNSSNDTDDSTGSDDGHENNNKENKNKKKNKSSSATNEPTKLLTPEQALRALEIEKEKREKKQQLLLKQAREEGNGDRNKDDDDNSETDDDNDENGTEDGDHQHNTSVSSSNNNNNSSTHKLSAAEKRNKDKLKDILPGNAGFAFGAPKFFAYLWPSQRLLRFRLLSASLIRIAHDESNPDLSTGFSLPNDPLGTYLRPDLSDSRIEFLFSSESCRESVQRIFDLLPKDAHNRLEMKGFVAFTLDLYNLYTPLYSDKANLLLAEAEWAARGVQDESLDFLLFYWFFFDVPLFLMRNGFVREIDYVQFWEFTYEQIFVNEIHSCCDFDQVILMRNIESNLQGKVPPSRLQFRANQELQMRKVRAKNHEKRSQLLIEERKAQAQKEHDEHERKKQEKEHARILLTSTSSPSLGTTNNHDDQRLLAEDLKEELSLESQQQQIVGASPSSPSSLSHAAPLLSKSEAAAKRAEETRVQQFVSFREYIDKFNQDGTPREDLMTKAKGRRRRKGKGSNKDNNKMGKTSNNANNKTGDSSHQEPQEQEEDDEETEFLKHGTDSFRLMLSYGKDDPRRYKTDQQLELEKHHHRRHHHHHHKKSDKQREDDDEDDYYEEEEEEDLDDENAEDEQQQQEDYSDKSPRHQQLMKRINDQARAARKQQKQEEAHLQQKENRRRVRSNRRALALLKRDQDAPENHIESLLDFVDNMSDSDLEETDPKGRLVVFDRFRLSREIRRRRDDDANRRSDGMPTRLAARTLILDRRREREVIRQEIAASRIASGEDEATVMKETEDDRLNDRVREQEEFEFGEFAPRHDSEGENEEEEEEDEEADSNNNNELNSDGQDGEDGGENGDQDQSESSLKTNNKTTRRQSQRHHRRRHTLLGVQDEKALREELKKMTHEAENEELAQEEDEDYASAARRRRRVARMLAVRRQERSRLQELAQSGSQLRKVNQYTMFGAPMLKMPGDTSTETARTPRQVLKPPVETHRIVSSAKSSSDYKTEMALPIMGGSAKSKIFSGMKRVAPLANTIKGTNVPTTTFSTFDHSCGNTARAAATTTGGASSAHVRAAMLQSGFSLPLKANSERARFRSEQLGRVRKEEHDHHQLSPPHAATARPHTVGTFSGSSAPSSNTAVPVNQTEEERKRKRKEAAEFIFGTGTLKEFEENNKKGQQHHQQSEEEGNNSNDNDETGEKIASEMPRWVEITENEAIILDQDISQHHEDQGYEDAFGVGAGKEDLGFSYHSNRGRYLSNSTPLSVSDSKLGDTLEDQRRPQPVILPRPSSLNPQHANDQKKKQSRHLPFFDFEDKNPNSNSSSNRKPRPPPHASLLSKNNRPSTVPMMMMNSTMCRPLMQSQLAPSSRERANKHPSTSHPDLQFARWLTALSRNAQSSDSRKPFENSVSEF